MTVSSGISELTDPSGEATGGSHVYNFIPDSNPASISGTKPQIALDLAVPNITAINTGQVRRWVWRLFTYRFVEANENTFQPGYATYFSRDDLPNTRLSAGIPTELAEAIATQGGDELSGFYVIIINWDASDKLIYINNTNKPNYLSLVTGYELDSRANPANPIITSPIDKTIKIKYYQQNKLESIPDLKSICWRVYECDLKANIAYTLPIRDCVLGTLYSDDPSILALIAALPTIAGKYPFSSLLPSAIAGLFVAWNELYNTANTNPTGASVFSETIKLRKLAANNDVWNNAELSTNLDINFDATHPMFFIDETRAYNWHVKPQADGSIGDLVMDGIRTIEMREMLDRLFRALQIENYQVEDLTVTPPLHYLDWYIKNSGGENSKLEAIYDALDAGKWSVDNETDPDNPIPRKWNIGTMTEAIARVLGLRRKADGKIDREKEKKLYLPATLNNPNLKGNNYSTNSFGDLGTAFPFIPTRYNDDGSATQLWDIAADLPQMMLAILRQIDVSLGIQHGSEIRVRSLEGRIKSYPNQLGVLLELLEASEAMRWQTEKNLSIDLVMGQEVRALMSMLGAPVTQKFLPLRDVGGRRYSLPYFGHQINRGSVMGKLGTLEVNAAIVNGVLMPKKNPDSFNPFRVFAKK